LENSTLKERSYKLDNALRVQIGWRVEDFALYNGFNKVPGELALICRCYIQIQSFAVLG